MENYCVSSQEQKMIELSTIAEVNGFHESQIALVDDYYENLGNAEKMGFTTFSPMEIVNLVNCFQNTDLEIVNFIEDCQNTIGGNLIENGIYQEN